MPPALRNGLHPDEALYGYWGLLVGQGGDLWLARVQVYKPPLLPYVVAGAQLLFGGSEFALRVPALAAGLLTVPLAAALARLAYREGWLGVPAAIVVALSPFAVLFSLTVFPDPLMVLLGLGACVAAVQGRPGVAGLLSGLAFAAKQTGLAWAPLALVLTLTGGSDAKARVAGFLAWFLMSVGLVVGWDEIRVRRGAQSFWEAGVTGYGGLRLVWPHELTVRLREWARLAGLLLASPLLSSLIAVGLLALVWAAAVRGRFTWGGLVDLSLVGFTVAYSLMHWLLAFPAWDRYLLPLAPILAVLTARLAWHACRVCEGLVYRLRPRWRRAPLSGAVSRSAILSQLAVSAALILLLALPALRATQNTIPVGGDHGVFDGIDEIATFLEGLPGGSVVYHHWLGWHYEYYLFRAPVYLAYWPKPTWLAQDVRAFGRSGPRYIAFPSWESAARVERALAREEYDLTGVLTTVTRAGAPSFSLYRIDPPVD